MGKGAQQTPGAGTLLAQAGPAGKVFTRDAVSKREDLCIVGNGRFAALARRARAAPFPDNARALGHSQRCTMPRPSVRNTRVARCLSPSLAAGESRAGRRGSRPPQTATARASGGAPSHARLAHG